MTAKTKDTGCCQRFNPKPFDGKTFHWKNKLFIKEDLPQIFHIPLPFTIGRMMGRMCKKAQDAKALPDMKEFLWLSYDTSSWNSENYIHVTKEVPDADNVKISGTFIAKVFDGPYNAVPSWFKQMDAYLAEKKIVPMKYYLYYTTCPKCAKVYGHNYAVIYAQVK